MTTDAEAAAAAHPAVHAAVAKHAQKLGGSGLAVKLGLQQEEPGTLAAIENSVLSRFGLGKSRQPTSQTVSSPASSPRSPSSPAMALAMASGAANAAGGPDPAEVRAAGLVELRVIGDADYGATGQYVATDLRVPVTTVLEDVLLAWCEHHDLDPQAVVLSFTRNPEKAKVDVGRTVGEVLERFVDRYVLYAFKANAEPLRIPAPAATAPNPYDKVGLDSASMASGPWVLLIVRSFHETLRRPCKTSDTWEDLRKKYAKLWPSGYWWVLGAPRAPREVQLSRTVGDTLLSDLVLNGEEVAVLVDVLPEAKPETSCFSMFR